MVGEKGTSGHTSLGFTVSHSSIDITGHEELFANQCLILVALGDFRPLINKGGGDAESNSIELEIAATSFSREQNAEPIRRLDILDEANANLKYSPTKYRGAFLAARSARGRGHVPWQSPLSPMI